MRVVEKVNEISLGDKFGAVAVKANGVRVEIDNDGTVTIKRNSERVTYREVGIQPPKPWPTPSGT